MNLFVLELKVYKEVAKYPRAQLERRGVLGKPQNLHWDELVEVIPLLWSISYEYTASEEYSSMVKTSFLIPLFPTLLNLKYLASL